MTTLREGRPRETEIFTVNKKTPERMKNARIAVVAENPAIHSHVKTQPELIDGEDRVRAGAYYGNIWISTYHEPSGSKAQNVDEANILFEKGDFGPRKVQLLRWNHCNDIETAIRFMGHVRDGYDKRDGKQVIKTKRAIDVMKFLLNEFREEPVTQEKLNELFDIATADLSDAGYDDVKKLIKKEIASKIILSTKNDSLGRVNELVSRSRIGSAWTKTTEELLFAGKVREKFPYLQELLITERSMERVFLEYGTRLIDNVLRMGNGNRDMDRAIRTLARYSGNYFKSGLVRANPYKGPAIIAHASLFRLDREYESGPRNVLVSYLGEEEAGKLIRQDPINVVYHDTTRSAMARWEEVSSRLSSARQELVAALRIGDEQL